MTERMTFKLHGPCNECPFRSDRPFYFRPGRRRSIYESIVNGDETFPCHKTLHDEEVIHCGGALVFLQKAGKLFYNVLYRLAAKAANSNPDMLRPALLQMDAPIMTEAEFLEGEPE